MTDLPFPEDFTPELRALLAPDLTKAAMIPAATVQKASDLFGMDTSTFMIRLLPLAAAYARVPLSGFHVGAVAMGRTTGNLYFGSNMEFSGHALSFSVHGEQSAINHAWHMGEVGLQALAVNAAPCGYCRQFMNEMVSVGEGFHVLMREGSDAGDYNYSVKPLSHYLPDSFGPTDLGMEGGLMSQQDQPLTIQSEDALAQAALQAARASYAPYTGAHCGIAVQQADGTVFTGRYGENAAYNPSFSPLESALALLNMRQPCQSGYNITAATLVEVDAPISQRSATEAVLSAIAPDVHLSYVKAEPV